ncbi:HAD family hydrolase [uncultured Shewanella sp.]|uniref:HAD family hydrolase n=1 Tax=uncultured Shewanella sp. TaxID=173975 RepID=UPI0026061017|nr:HAD family hydrolase [uncultured Shewanella sp.]
MKYKLVSFDFDGTLCNTFAAIKAALSIVIPNVNLDSLPDKLTSGESFITVLHTLTGSALSDRAILHLYDNFCQVYNTQCTALQILYPDTTALLTHFSSQGVKLAIVSNKEEKAIVDFLDVNGLGTLFDLIIGERKGLRKKPSADSYHNIIQPTLPKLAPQDMLHFGDTVIDIDYAKAIGASSVYVCHGFGRDDICIAHEPTYVCSSFKECFSLFFD